MSGSSTMNRGASEKGETAEDIGPPRALPAAARRALEEAAERRRAASSVDQPTQEIGGRGGLDPARYGDWEVNGRASDF